MWLEHIWHSKNLCETRVVRASEGQLQRQVKKNFIVKFSIFFKIKVCCVCSLESPHRKLYTILAFPSVKGYVKLGLKPKGDTSIMVL